MLEDRTRVTLVRILSLNFLTTHLSLNFDFVTDM